MKKTCSTCKIEKDLNEFHKFKKAKDGHHWLCKECAIEYQVEYRKKNKARISQWGREYYSKNREYVAKRGRGYRKKNKTIIEKRKRDYYLKNKEHVKKRIKEWQLKNREKMLQYSKAREAKISSTPQLKINRQISKSIRRSLKGNKSGQHWEDIVGYTLNDLIKHIERQFTEGMTWDNHGKNGWEIDHIIPSSVFNFSDPSHRDFKRCWALSNLQPLWKSENAGKCDKLDEHFQPSLAF